MSVHEYMVAEDILFFGWIYFIIQEHLLPYFKDNNVYLKLKTQLLTHLNLVRIKLYI